jgi:hypothetical protein
LMRNPNRFGGRICTRAMKTDLPVSCDPVVLIFWSQEYA